MSTLRIFDVSNYIYAGTFANNAKYVDGVYLSALSGKFEEKSMPIGGINMLFNTLFKDNQKDVINAFVFDSKAYDRYEMMQELTDGQVQYKEGRKKVLGVNQQQSLAYEVFKEAGYNVFKREGYEADDIIYYLVERYKNSFSSVEIYTKDSDLLYLVQPNVSVMPVGSKGSVVTMSNYEDSIEKGYTVKYNTAIWHKLERGDKADKIPPISSEIAMLISNYILPDEYSKCGDINYFRQKVAEATNNNRKTMLALDIRLPLPMDEEVVLYETVSNPSYVFELGTMLNNYNVRGKKKDTQVRDEIVDVFNKYLEQYIMEVESGWDCLKK